MTGDRAMDAQEEQLQWISSRPRQASEGENCREFVGSALCRIEVGVGASVASSLQSG
jgi:hypothetical protein